MGLSLPYHLPPAQRGRGRLFRRITALAAEALGIAAEPGRKVVEG